MESISENNRIGIMGGTFDPIHYGHLVTAEAIRHQFDLKKVIFVPSGNPPHKKNRLITRNKHRYLMTVLATVTNEYFDVSRIELNKEGYTYTIDTIKEFREIYGEGNELFFITGADALLEIFTWKNAEELLELCQFIAATRPGFDSKEIDQQLKNIWTRFGKHIYAVEVPSLAISSTDIRERVNMDRPIKYLVPEAVENYIKKNNLYK
ncbi:MAG: nicotinate-nucleotide adenylyltransferase [Clostridia bacterium]|nr:nicotinate-nucleotide adenylyltransferase [Clostridia bacterium]